MPARILRAALSYFALVFGAGFALALIRVPFLAPRFGERIAELLEMPLMLLVMLLAARFVVHRFALPPRGAPRLCTGLLALALLLGAELGMLLLQQRSLQQYIAARDPLSGSVYLAMLLLFAALPALLMLRHAR